MRRAAPGMKPALIKVAKPAAAVLRPIARAEKPCSPRRTAISVIVSDSPTPTIETVAMAQAIRRRARPRPRRAILNGQAG